MIVTLHMDFRFEASHQLSHLAPDHPCHNLHGHGYSVRVEVRGEVNRQSGFLIDYADIAGVARPFIDKLDHSHLNDIEDLKLATTEHIAHWLWKHLQPDLPQLYAVQVSETNSTGCIYHGE